MAAAANPTPGVGPDVQARRSLLLKRLGRYTRFVKLSKVLLILVSLGLLGTIVVLPVLKAGQGQRLVFAPGISDGADATPVMANPKFQGMDSKDQPYIVTADSAKQQDANVIVLDKVSADLSMKDGTWMLLTANSGHLNLAEKDLLLLSEVKLFHDGGYELTTERIRVDMAKGEAFGDMPLEGQGGVGYIRAAQFAAYERGNRMMFYGPVKVIIKP